MSRPDGWVAPGDPGYEAARAALSASAWQPGRFPAAITAPRDADAVVRALVDARDRGLRVGVRGGGHSLSAAHLPDAGLVLDLSGLTRFDVDQERSTAWVGPGVRVLDAARALDAAGRSFPIGHSPTVGLGGYLLAGGNGWNTPVWGHACERVLAADVVLPDGRRTVVDARTDPELLRVLRGAGPAFPGVVLAFRLQLTTERPRIRRVMATVDAGRPEELGEVLDGLVASLPPPVELTVFWHPARAVGQAPTATVAATSFAPDEGEVLQAVRRLPSLTIAEADAGTSLSALVSPLPTHAGDAMFSHHTWTDAGYRDVLPLLPARDHHLSACSSILLTTAARRADGAPPADALYAPAGTMSVSPYAHWDPATTSPEHPISWAHTVVADLDHLGTGRYVGEADLGRTTPEECFGAPGAALLRRVRDRVDPEGTVASPFAHRHVADET